MHNRHQSIDISLQKMINYPAHRVIWQLLSVRVYGQGYETGFMSTKRKKAYLAGVRAEMFASVLLMTKGYRILAWRYKTPVGEIDLIAVRKNRFAFVEVKARPATVEALQAVTPKQQQRIRRAASHWLAKQKGALVHEIGFDVIAVVPWKIPQHKKDAFPHTPY